MTIFDPYAYEDTISDLEKDNRILREQLDGLTSEKAELEARVEVLLSRLEDMVDALQNISSDALLASRQ